MSTRFLLPLHLHADLTIARLRALARILVQAFNRAHRRLRAGFERAPSAAFNRLDVARNRALALAETVSWLQVVTEYGWSAFHLLLGDGGARPPIALRFSVAGGEVPPLLPKERTANEAVWGNGQLAFWPEEQVQLPAGVERTPILRLELEHNGADDLRLRRATAVKLKLLNEAGTGCYETWAVWSARSARPTRAPAARLVAQHPTKTPPDHVLPAEVEFRDDHEHEGTGD